MVSPLFLKGLCCAFLGALPALSLYGANLIWSDEFNDADGLPSVANWTYETGGGGWGNSESQYYTNRRDASANAFVEDGVLVIEARKETYDTNAYTSARINSTQDWTYGRFVIRARLPDGDGTWPAIWMMPADSEYGTWPDSGEIDIMEHLGKELGTIHATLHTKAQNHVLGTSRSSTIIISDVNTEFHNYTIDWTPRGIWAYVDDQQYFFAVNETINDATKGYEYWPFDKQFYLILNVALGGWGGTIDDTVLPKRMEIDYVRVYDLTNGGVSAPSRYDGVYESGWTKDVLLDWLYVPYDPWVWCSPLAEWVYVEKPPVSTGAWVYSPRNQE